MHLQFRRTQLINDPPLHLVKIRIRGFLSSSIAEISLRIDNFSAVINVSSVSLTRNQFSVLSNGLSFCPLPISVDALEIKNDLSAFARELRFKEFFHGNQNPTPVGELPAAFTSNDGTRSEVIS